MFDPIEIGLIKKLGGSGGSSGGSADILNADGVIKQEHLPEGYPYKTVEEGYILEECQPIFEDEMFILTDSIVEKLEAGKEYTVNYNGTDYKTTALDIEGMGIGLGNAGYILEDESLITDEPYVMMAFYPENEMAAMAGGMLLAVDGATSVTVSIKDKILTYHPISEKYLPPFAALTVKINVNWDSKNNMQGDKSFAEVFAVLESGGDAVMCLYPEMMEGLMYARVTAIEADKLTFALITAEYNMQFMLNSDDSVTFKLIT